MADDARRAMFVIDRHESGRQAILDGLVGAVLRLLGLLGSGDVSREGARADLVNLVEVARQNIADLQWAYLDAMSDTTVAGAPGLPESDVAERVARLVIEGADGLAEDDVRALVAEPLTQAEHEATRQHGAASEGAVIGYRRVVHPELSEGGTCGLCVLATHQVYTRGDLDPIHENCKCTVAEITAASDPGDSLNNLELGDVYGDAGSSDGRAAKKVRYRLDDDGRLVRHADPKQRKPENDPDEVRRRRRQRDESGSTEDRRRRISTLEAHIADLERRASLGEDVDLELDAARRRLRSLRRAA